MDKFYIFGVVLIHSVLKVASFALLSLFGSLPFKEKQIFVYYMMFVGQYLFPLFGPLAGIFCSLVLTQNFPFTLPPFYVFTQCLSTFMLYILAFNCLTKFIFFFF